jgi:hypothetical protein
MGNAIIGQPSPLRYCPAGLKTKKQSTWHAEAGILAIKPKRGAWEGHTGYDVPIICPAFADDMGNVIPPLEYKPASVQITNMPFALKLGSQATDAQVLAPSKATQREAQGLSLISQMYLDRDRIFKGYYEGAFWAYGELDPDEPDEVMWWTCGEIGTGGVDLLTATIELSTYDELANRDVGDVIHVQCQVGTRLGEKFGTMRCRNEVMNDGPLRADWTAVAMVLDGSTKRELILGFGPEALSGATLHAGFAEHLANGDLEFPQSGGGLNSEIEMPVRDGEALDAEDYVPINQGIPYVLAGWVGNINYVPVGWSRWLPEDAVQVRVFPKLSLPYPVFAGDVVHLVAGCDRSKTDCLFFENLPNMRAQDPPGNSELTARSHIK